MGGTSVVVTVNESGPRSVGLGGVTVVGVVAGVLETGVVDAGVETGVLDVGVLETGVEDAGVEGVPLLPVHPAKASVSASSARRSGRIGIRGATVRGTP
jgi:hypothetical protein